MINLATKQSKVENGTHIRGHFASTACTLEHERLRQFFWTLIYVLFLHINYERVGTEDNTIMIISEAMHTHALAHVVFAFSSVNIIFFIKLSLQHLVYQMSL